jgi:capsular exopolysaccharide synthesis family protein
MAPQQEQQDDPAQRLTFLTLSGSPFAESLRSIRANIASLLTDKGCRFTVISPWVDDGKSLVAANLSVALAQTGRSVMLVDADLRRPTLSSYFRASGALGFSNMIEQATPLLETLVKTSVPNFYFLPAGTCNAHPSNLMASDSLGLVTAELQNSAHFVIFDTPPLSVCSDGFLLARATDHTIIVVNQRSWQGEPEARFKRRLEEAGVNVLGVILNETDAAESGYSAGYNSYYYYGGRKPQPPQG